MSTYAIGDVQGCHGELLQLLEHLRFDPARDHLWFAGDLVNRGPRSLEVLRFVRGLGERAVTVLGNHDLHLVAAALSGRTRPGDTFQDILAAPDRDALLAWLRAQPLVHHAQGFLMVHAGLPPDWDVAQALACSAEAQKAVASPEADDFFRHHMYGDGPHYWRDAATGPPRLRFIINCCTRLRFCAPDGRAEFRHKGAPEESPDLLPWFAVAGRRSAGTPVLFGHWSLLGRVHWPEHQAWGLDTGCVWGRRLTALRLEDCQLFSVPAAQAYGAD